MCMLMQYGKFEVMYSAKEVNVCFSKTQTSYAIGISTRTIAIASIVFVLLLHLHMYDDSSIPKAIDLCSY